MNENYSRVGLCYKGLIYAPRVLNKTNYKKFRWASLLYLLRLRKFDSKFSPLNCDLFDGKIYCPEYITNKSFKIPKFRKWESFKLFELRHIYVRNWNKRSWLINQRWSHAEKYLLIDLHCLINILPAIINISPAMYELTRS